MICRCGIVTSFTVAQIDGKFCYDLWVCENCRQPTRLVFEKLTANYRPADAKALLSVFGRTDGIQEITWALSDGTRKVTLSYLPYPRKVDMPNEGALLQQTWHLLDSKVAIILAEPNGPGDNALEAQERETARQQARGIAEVLAILMRPFFDKPDNIVREAVKRYKAKQAGQEHETPGLAESIWDPHTRWDGTPFSVENEKKARRSKTTATTLKPKDIEGIKSALQSGMFDEKQLAEIYKVSVATVKSVAAS